LKIAFQIQTATFSHVFSHPTTTATIAVTITTIAITGSKKTLQNDALKVIISADYCNCHDARLHI